MSRDKKIKKVDFENFLMEKHASQYVGTDDMMPDDFNDWVQDLGVDEIIEYGNKYASSLSQINALDKKVDEGKLKQIIDDHIYLIETDRDGGLDYCSITEEFIPTLARTIAQKKSLWLK